MNENDMCWIVIVIFLFGIFIGIVIADSCLFYKYAEETNLFFTENYCPENSEFKELQNNTVICEMQDNPILNTTQVNGIQVQVVGK